MTRIAARLRGERGFTLVELLVAMVILGVLLSSLMTAFIVVNRSTAVADQRVEDVGLAQVAMAAVSRSLRTAIAPRPEPAFTAATGDRVELYANLGGDVTATGPARPVPSRVEYVVIDTGDGWALQETITPGALDPVTGHWVVDGSADPRVRVIARNLENPSSVFLYHTADNPEGTSAPDADPGNLEIRRILAVTIRLEIRGGAHLGHSPTVLENRVRLPNL